MPIFSRKPKPPPELPVQLPIGERCDRATRATLTQGKQTMSGALYMTNQRLMFYASKGEARWLVVPFGEVKSAGVYPSPRGHVGAPQAGGPALFIETTKGEHIWLAFDRKEQDAWLADVRKRAEEAAAATEDEA
jgi:hypothetical protein